MRNYRTAIALAILTSTVSVLSAIGQTNLREVDFTVNGVRSGSEIARINRLGKPRRVKNLGLNACADQFERKFYYPGLEIGVLGSKDVKSGEVYSIMVSSNQWLISPGLRVGPDKKTVLAKFGKPVSDDGKTILYVTKDNLGLVSFEFRNDRLVKAEMTETLC